MAGTINKPLDISAFAIPEKNSGALAPEFRQFRTQSAVWDESMVREYWVPPAQIGLENLAAMNDKNIERLFSDVK